MSEETPEIGYIRVLNREHLQTLLGQQGKCHYTYILRIPDGIQAFGGEGTPFYVGIGQGQRIFAHLDEATKTHNSSRKLDTIRHILRSGKNVIHTIDAFFDFEPWNREESLITTIGQIKHGTGPLTNDQDYSSSYKVNGIEVRKYKDDHLNDPRSMPKSFDKLKDVRLAAGTIKPKSEKSVFGKIYAMLEKNPGVTGSQLVKLLQSVDFSDNKSAYTQSGEVCTAWLCGYIKGGFRPDRQHIRRFGDDG